MVDGRWKGTEEGVKSEQPRWLMGAKGEERVKTHSSNTDQEDLVRVMEKTTLLKFFWKRCWRSPQGPDDPACGEVEA
ncbi:unnamed protein product, partial [Timema podura]|nr:unnamed protein product [Timema podura]